VRRNLLLGTAAVGVLITGAIAQTNSGIERIKDAAGYSKKLSTGDKAHESTASQTNQNAASPQQAAQSKKTVRTVYPNTQNAEQAARESRSAQGGADASRRQPGDVAPLSTTQAPAPQANTQTSPPAPVPQPSSTGQSTAASSAHESAPTPSTPPSSTQSAQGTQPAQSMTAPAPAPQQPVPTTTAQESRTPSEPAHQASTGVIALDTQQQTSLGEAIARHNVKPLTSVTFSMALGTKVPASVQLRALPSDVATFVPQYRGYSYFVVEEQMVIVDPATQSIVAIVPYTASTIATRAAEPPPATRTAEPAPAPHAVGTRPAKSREAKTTKRHPRPIAQKPMVTRSVKLSTEEKDETRRPTTEQRKSTRSVSKREPGEREAIVHDYRERAPRSVTIEEQDEPVYREVVPRPRGFFDFFRGDDDGWR